MIRGDEKLIRLWLTLLSLYRVIEFPGKFKVETIIKPGKDFATETKMGREVDTFSRVWFSQLS
jgi:hypothetical protein